MSKQDSITIYMTRDGTGRQLYQGWCAKPDRKQHYHDGRWHPTEDLPTLQAVFKKAGMAIEPGGDPVAFKLVPCE